MKVFIAVIMSLFIFVLCSKERNGFELRKEIQGFKLDCQSNPVKAKYVHYSRKSEDGIWWKEIRSKKGRVQCGDEYFDFNAVSSDGNKLAYIDVTYKQKTTRLAKITLNESRSDLLNDFDIFYLDLHWKEIHRESATECVFDSEKGTTHCRML